MALEEKYKKWLKATESANDKSETNDSIASTSKMSNIASTSKKSDDEIDFDFNKQNQIKIFENDSLILYIEKATHQRQTRFKLQDSLFKIKAQTKQKSSQSMLLKDLLQIFETALQFIISNIKTFFKAENHHIAYLTMYQEPMVNGINTGIN